MASSASGAGISETGTIEPLDLTVSVSIDIKNNPRTEVKQENASSDQAQSNS